MELIKPSIEILPIDTDIFKRIETIGRVCVRSEDKITNESAMKFCTDRLKSGHTAIFNHGIAYFRVHNQIEDCYITRLLCEFPHIKIYQNDTDDAISLNRYLAVPFRCYLDYKANIKYNLFSFRYYRDFEIYRNLLIELFENTIFTKLINIISNDFFNFTSISEEEALKVCPDIVHISIKFTTDRGITHELVRHTIVAFMQESTRWCNYSKNKFSNEITYIQPFWIEDDPSKDHEDSSTFRQALRRIQQIYLELIDYGWTAQQARSILPNTLKSDIWVTATIKEWYGITTKVKIGDIEYEERKGIFSQRLHKTAHPQMIEVMELAIKELNKVLYGHS